MSLFLGDEVTEEIIKKIIANWIKCNNNKKKEEGRKKNVILREYITQSTGKMKVLHYAYSGEKKIFHFG